MGLQTRLTRLERVWGDWISRADALETTAALDAILARVSPGLRADLVSDGLTGLPWTGDFLAGTVWVSFLETCGEAVRDEVIDNSMARDELIAALRAMLERHTR